MKRLFTFILVCLSAAAVQAGEPRAEIKPEGAISDIAIVNSGKIRSYFALSAKKPSVILIKGPGELRILTRARFTPKIKGLLNYRVSYKIDGGEDHLMDVEGVKRSNEAAYKDETLGIPGDSHDLTMRLGRGYHSVELILRDSSTKVAARFLFTPGKEVKMKWLALTPAEPYEPVDVLSKETTAHYFRFSSEKPIKIEVIGPTELRVLTRAENSYDMQGSVNYRVQVRQYGSVVRTYQLNSKRSETATYRDSTAFVPGKAREITLLVPKGKQQYEIGILETGSFLGSLLIPEKDADLEE